jgi:hypothetical protein
VFQLSTYKVSPTYNILTNYDYNLSLIDENINIDETNSVGISSDEIFTLENKIQNIEKHEF